jgi:CheY-like chemotaxis protein
MGIVESQIILSDLMQEVFEHYKLKQKKNELESEISLKLSFESALKGVSINTDPHRLKQILNNLLENAFKFTPNGSIEFGCNLIKVQGTKDPGFLQFFVKDTGIGIPADKYELIFDRFCQADDSITARQYGGTGLGLSIVKGIVLLMHGKIWLESKENVGTTFYFTLPFVQPEIPEKFNTELNNHTSILWKNKTILIVEDDEANSVYLKEVLSGKGLRVFNAYSGKEALQIYKKNPNLDLILMDIRLPDTNGLNLTRIIKKNNPRIVVIAQTAYAATTDMQDCLDAGCNDYLSKPISYEKLILLLDQYLNKN